MSVANCGASSPNLRKARLTGIRVKLSVEPLGGKLANLPDGGVGRARPSVL